MIVPHETRPKLITALRDAADQARAGPEAQARQHPAVRPGGRRRLRAAARRRRQRAGTREVAERDLSEQGRGVLAQVAVWTARTASRTIASVTGRPSASVAPWRTHCHTWPREISAVAASSIRP